MSHSGLAVIQLVERLFEAWDVRIPALVCQHYLFSHMKRSSQPLQVHGSPEDVLSSDEISAPAMRRRIGEWIVFSSGPKGFCRFPCEAWKKLPRGLSWMHQLYAQQYLENELHLESSVEVDVQGATFPSNFYMQLLKGFSDRPS
jgi:hypothetical protein